MLSKLFRMLHGDPQHRHKLVMTDSEFLTTREVAELLRLKERKVYDLAAEQSIPCTRATGKLLFPKSEVLQWLRQHSTGISVSAKPALFSGSHDPLLEWAIRESRCEIATLFDGSIDGCQKLLHGEASVAALHIFNSEKSTWNAEYVRSNHSQENSVLVSFVTRSRGIVYSDSVQVNSFTDIEKLSLAGRQAGAGSQIVLESMLIQHAVDPASLNVPVVARTELDAVLAVVEGVAQCTIGLQAIAAQHQLGYLHLIDESLDLLVDRQFWFEPQMQKFLEFCRSEAFLQRVDALSGYRLDSLFTVRWNNW